MHYLNWNMNGKTQVTYSVGLSRSTRDSGNKREVSKPTPLPNLKINGKTEDTYPVGYCRII